jgi:hypothetical protein
MLQFTVIILLAVMMLIALILRHPRVESIVGSGEETHHTPPILMSDVPFMKCVPPIQTELANKHHGQRKLFIAELDLLTRAVSEYGCKYFVYAGSAPGIHIGRFMYLFPSLTFVLIDPNEFTIVVDGEVINYTPSDERAVYLADGVYDAYKIQSVGDSKMIRGIDGKAYHRGSLPVTEDYVKTIHEHPETRIFIIERLMTRELARHLKGLSGGDDGGVVFMSDIRTNSGEDMPTNGDLLWNMAQMFVWVSEMQPLIFSHKHRPVLGDAEILDYMRDDIESAKELGLDLVKEPQKYLAGDAYLQTWTTRHSPETRLVGLRIGKSGGSDETLCNYLPIPPDYVNPPNPSNILPGVANSYPIAIIDTIDYDQRMLYHNRINRSSQTYDHPAKHIHGIDGCYDCAQEALTWERYYLAQGITPTQMMVTNDMIHLARHLVVDYRGMKDDLVRLHQKTHKTRRNFAINTSAERLMRGSGDDIIYDPVD